MSNNALKNLMKDQNNELNTPKVAPNIWNPVFKKHVPNFSANFIRQLAIFAKGANQVPNLGIFSSSFPFIGHAIAGTIDMFRLPFIAMIRYFSGEKINFTRSQAIKLFFGTVILGLVIANALVSFPYSSAAFGIAIASTLLSRNIWSYWKSYQRREELENKLPSLQDALDQAETQRKYYHKMVNDGTLTTEDFDDLKTGMNENFELVKRLRLEKAMLQQKLDRKNPTLFGNKTIGITIAALTLTSAVLCLLFPPLAGPILLGFSGVGCILAATILTRSLKSMLSTLFNKPAANPSSSESTQSVQPHWSRPIFCSNPRENFRLLRPDQNTFFSKMATPYHMKEIDFDQSSSVSPEEKDNSTTPSPRL
ncbi:MAG: hypothetical protein NTW94_04075 [Legionellales bacterium]|nr:hypothetical protein [Legionellales bacterium]